MVFPDSTSAYAHRTRRPLATQNTASFTIVPTYGLDTVAGTTS